MIVVMNNSRESDNACGGDGRQDTCVEGAAAASSAINVWTGEDCTDEYECQLLLAAQYYDDSDSELETTSEDPSVIYISSSQNDVSYTVCSDQTTLLNIVHYMMTVNVELYLKNVHLLFSEYLCSRTASSP